MNTTDAIKRAIEKGGYKERYVDEGHLHGSLCIEQILLDPAFWQCLSKAEGWECKRHKACKADLKWKKKWHSFIDALADGKTADEFFQELLK